MKTEEIKELIKQELKEKLQISISQEREMFTSCTNIEVQIHFDGELITRSCCPIDHE